MNRRIQGDVIGRVGGEELIFGGRRKIKGKGREDRKYNK